MKRKLYFWIDRLQIRRSERISIGILLIILCVLSVAEAMMTPVFNSDPEYYAELEQIFSERSERAETEMNGLLARYVPEPEPDPQTITRAGYTSADETVYASESGVHEVPGERVNINTASAEELEKLPGIGPAYAERIVQWRADNGRFTSVEQLLEIRGIGERRLENLRPHVTLGDEHEEPDHKIQ